MADTLNNSPNGSAQAGTRSLTALAVIGAVSAIGSTIASIASANHQQRKQEEMWERNNAYNTPEEQAKRLRSAGFNPALAMENGLVDNGNSSSPAGVVDPLNFESFGSQAADGMRIANEMKLANSQSAKLDSETEAQNWRNKFAGIREVLDIRKTASEIGENTMQGKKLMREADYLEKEINAYDEISRSQIRLNNANARKVEADADYQEIMNRFAPEQQKIITDNLNAENERIWSAVRANDAESALKYAQQALTNAQKHGVVLDNNIKNDAASAIVDSYFADADQKYYQSQISAKEYHEGAGARLLPSGGSGHVKYYMRQSGTYKSQYRTYDY